MANGNGTVKKIVYGTIMFLLTASFTGYIKYVNGQIADIQSGLVQVHSSDSLKAVVHDSLPMHEGSRLQFEKIERRYIRDSASTVQFRQQTNEKLQTIQEGIGDLTKWLKQNTNHDSANSRNP